ncbi:MULTISPECIES: DUF2513 domain-containing protein [unclassified Lysobacter]|uniref:DUF2513 domain-containing protein n=1 Tax=unclassified Lysobacter TaxID=2635362 RepID=UPI001BE8AAC8|nr:MULTISPECIES: DUF2513 domain-containing protein [unclassified Lysobacter]MBT2748630.1 DUF2513 domain-containing protein [Lysobacter sp. ISL-42]MBT2751565.1 DUF2513 domain-containing protein [Lysobacter sp. ISL-50]MBT2775759.1 DUF2513 domain-containing protein [Lysobacter sp. ISL-54]MBT2782276.1 DUF2513 domain-containing protein [Lysobacter sp. ISL-52]
MRRNMEFIRKVLLAVELRIPHRLIDGYSQDELRCHRFVLINEGLADGCLVNDPDRAVEVPTAVMSTRLTRAVHDFIEPVGDETCWGKVKAFLADSGKQITIETVKSAVTTAFMATVRVVTVVTVVAMARSFSLDKRMATGLAAVRLCEGPLTA